MWKTVSQTLLIALTLTTFGTGCDLSDLANAFNGGTTVTEPGDADPTEPAPPTDPDCYTILPYPYDPGEGCEEPIGPPVMPTEPTEPWFECDIALEACLSDPTAGSEAFCIEEYDLCLNDDILPPPPIDPCDEEFNLCLNSQTDWDVCEAEYEQCWSIEPPLPPVPMDGCFELHDSCLYNGVSPELCDEVFQECIEAHEPCDEPGYPGDDGGSDDGPEPEPTPDTAP